MNTAGDVRAILAAYPGDLFGRIAQALEDHLVTWQEVLGPSRARRIMRARRAMYAVLYEGGFSVQEIADLCNRSYAATFYGLHPRRKKKK